MLAVVPPHLAGLLEELHLDHSGGIDVERVVERIWTVCESCRPRSYAVEGSGEFDNSARLVRRSRIITFKIGREDCARRFNELILTWIFRYCLYHFDSLAALVVG